MHTRVNIRAHHTTNSTQLRKAEDIITPMSWLGELMPDPMGPLLWGDPEIPQLSLSHTGLLHVAVCNPRSKAGEGQHLLKDGPSRVWQAEAGFVTATILGQPGLHSETYPVSTNI